MRVPGNNYLRMYPFSNLDEAKIATRHENERVGVVVGTVAKAQHLAVQEESSKRLAAEGVAPDHDVPEERAPVGDGVEDGVGLADPAAGGVHSAELGAEVGVMDEDAGGEHVSVELPAMAQGLRIGEGFQEASALKGGEEVIPFWCCL